MAVRDDRALTRASRFMALVLRHAPQEAGIELDARAWAPVADLLRGMKARGHGVDRATLAAIVAADDKGRYELSGDGRRIRALQGHSVDVYPDLVVSVPPEFLWHGTVARVVDAISREGLRPMERRFVHLSIDEDTASDVGDRRGRAVLLPVRSAAMHAAGHMFHISRNGVWLAAAVPPEWIDMANARWPDAG